MNAAALALWRIDQDPGAVEALANAIKSKPYERPIQVMERIVGPTERRRSYERQSINEFEALALMGTPSP